MKTNTRSTLTLDVLFFNIFLSLILLLITINKMETASRYTKSIVKASAYHHADIKQFEQENCSPLDPAEVAKINANITAAIDLFDKIKLFTEKKFPVIVIGVRTKDNDKICVRFLERRNTPPIKPQFTRLI